MGAAKIIPRLLTDDEAAAYIGMSVSYLRNGRANGVTGDTPTPPCYTKIGRSIRYDVKDLDDWIDAQSRFSTKAQEYAEVSKH